MNKHIQAIIEKPMNRREFLGYIGAAILAVVGVSGMIKALLHHGEGKNSSPVAMSGYGSTPYGGSSNQKNS